MSSLGHAARSVLRPLIPDWIMARRRGRLHSRAVRHNVDLYLASDADARRWRAFTPDTYRVVTTHPIPRTLDDVVTLGPPDPTLPAFLGFAGSEAVASAQVSRPSLRAMRVTEPIVSVRTLVTTAEVLERVGLDVPIDAATAFRVLLDAGAHVGVAPEPVSGAVDRGLPPIAADTVVVMAAVPLHDIGGGSRAAQIAFELVRRGYHVVYVAAYPSSEAVELGLRYPHVRLEEYPIDTFDPEEVIGRASPGVVVVEAPIEGFVAPIDRLAGSGWRVIYDLIDDWTDDSLGGMWYKRSVEDRVIELADGLSASAPDLQERLVASGRPAVLVPNAVNTSVFGRPGSDHRPEDLPEGRIIGYHGSLYGEWFDWEALRGVAAAYPGFSVVVIGDHRGLDQRLPANVVFLGLKGQDELPAYVRRFDVGIVPFELSDVTHAVSPLKVYEYLACGVPVAAPPLRALAGVDGVATDVDLVAAVAAALEMPRPDGRAALDAHSWGSRLGVMFSSIDLDLAPVVESDLLVLRAPPRRYARSDRWIR